MGNKINSNALRLGISRGWKSIWYADGKNYERQFLEDLKIRGMLRKKLNPAGLGDIIVKRQVNKVEIEIFVARPGVAIGRGGTGIEETEKELKKLMKTDVEIKINEVKKPDLSARIIARSIADAIERRQPPKLLMLSYKSKAVLAGAKGVKISIGGRVSGNNQARTIKTSAGSLPLQTLKADIDYAEERAQTVNSGIIGVKVWVYNPVKPEKK